MIFRKFSNSDVFKWSLEMMAIANRGVKMAIEENERLGLPNIFSHNHRIYYRMPDGSITEKSPFKKSKQSALNIKP